jgi:hypothetical protein
MRSTYREFGGAKDFAIGIHSSVQGPPLLSLPVVSSRPDPPPRALARAVKAKATQAEGHSRGRTVPNAGSGIKKSTQTDFNCQGSKRKCGAGINQTPAITHSSSSALLAPTDDTKVIL